jgi:hypothetical protein
MKAESSLPIDWGKEMYDFSRHRTSTLHTLLTPFAVLRVRIRMDPHHFGKLDPDPHQSEKPDADPDPH